MPEVLVVIPAVVTGITSLDNLELTTNGSHIIEHNTGYRGGFQKGYRDGKGEQIKELKNRIKELECQIYSQ